MLVLGQHGVAHVLGPHRERGADDRGARAARTLKRAYLPKMIKGEWSGTMCLTEAHCGTDLGILRTKAEPRPTAPYAITGTKIFISAGEHDLTQNIVHLVLARLPDAPAGHARHQPVRRAEVPARRDRRRRRDATASMCGSIEHKMGIHASPTCVMHFNDSIGWLIGKPNEGLACMFTMMNHARLGVGLQGHGLSELAWQASIAYANDRLQGRAMTGAKEPGKAADPIIVHPDVRRMLLTQKAFVEGGRVLCFLTGREIDSAHLNPDRKPRRRFERPDRVPDADREGLPDRGGDGSDEPRRADPRRRTASSARRASSS